MRYYTVEFTYADEATPREPNYRTVRAVSYADAREGVIVWATLNGDRIMTASDEFTTSY